MKLTRACGFIAALILLTATNSTAKSNALGKLVILGDSLTAGFQNFSLFTSSTVPGTPAGGQEYGYADVIAQQAGIDLQLPVISYPGIPPALTVDGSREPGIGDRVNKSVQTLNLSVPAYTLSDALNRTVDLSNVANPVDALAINVLGYPGLATGTAPCGTLAFAYPKLSISELKCAADLKPDTVIVSLGNNDALQALTFGTPPTSPLQFGLQYSAIVASLTATGAKIVAANIPDVTALPFLIPVPNFQMKCGFIPTGASSSDFVVANIVDPAFSGDVCRSYSVRSAALVRSAQEAVVAYNQIIATSVRTVNGVVVDFNALFGSIVRDGYRVNGRTLTTAAGGGIFSLDGIHPTNTGYAIIANEFIKTMNTSLGAGIPPVSVVQVSKTDPLLPPKR